MQNNIQPNKANEKNKDRILYAILTCMVIIIIVLVILLLRACPGQPAEDPGLERDQNASLGQLENKTQEEIQAELDRIVEEGMFNISINPNPIFESGEAEGDLRIENIPANHYNMSVTITLDETGEVIYQTGIIEPNHYIQNDVLDVVLTKGSYSATATFTAYDAETNAVVGQAAAKITILVQN